MQKEIDILVGMHATYESVEREAKNDDIVRLMQQQPLMVNLTPTWTRDNQATRIGAANYSEPFDRHYWPSNW